MSTTLERPIEINGDALPELLAEVEARTAQRPTLTDAFLRFWNAEPVVDPHATVVIEPAVAPEPPPTVPPPDELWRATLQHNASYYGLSTQQVAHLVAHFNSARAASEYLGNLCYCSVPRASFVGPYD